MLTTTRTRIGAGLAAAYVLLILIGNSIATAGSSQDSHPSGQQVLHDVAAQAGDTAPAIGFALEVLGFVAFLVFLGYLVAARRDHSADTAEAVGAARALDGPATATALVAGLVMLAVKLGSAAPVIALDLDYKRLSPELAQVLSDMNGAAFVISWLPFAVFIAAVALTWSKRGLVGRPTWISGVVLGVAGVPAAMIGMQDVAGANPVVFLLSLLWLLVVGLRLLIRPGVAIS